MVVLVMPFFQGNFGAPTNYQYETAQPTDCTIAQPAQLHKLHNCAQLHKLHHCTNCTIAQTAQLHKLHNPQTAQ